MQDGATFLHDPPRHGHLLLEFRDSGGQANALISLHYKQGIALTDTELGQQRLGQDDSLYLAIARPRPRQGSARLILPGISSQAASSLPQAA